jgi:hypothetical protein
MKFKLHQPPKSNGIDQINVQFNQDQGQTEVESTQSQNKSSTKY